MKTVKVHGVTYMEVEISPLEALNSLKESLGLSDNCSESLCIKDGLLTRVEDVSYHGSPVYEYTCISNNPKWVELYNSIMCLEEYLKNTDSELWKKMLGGKNFEPKG